MSYRRVQFGTVFVLSLIATALLASGVPALTGPTTIAPLVERVQDAVVNITAQRSGNSDFYGQRWQPRESRAIGSGVIIDAENGHVVTNEHLIRNAERVIVTLVDEREFVAEIVGADAATDVAVLKIPSDDLKALPLADSDKARVGDFVLAIGNPFGQLQHTVTSGIVSGLGRKGLGIEDIEDFIQTDAAINEGNSGGPLLNFSGEIIGINTAILGRAGNLGIAFAIPSNLVREIVNELIEFGGITRGFLGVYMSDIPQEFADDYSKMFELEEIAGVLITGVSEGSAAFDAGIERFDVITSFNGESISGPTELRSEIKLAKIGDTVPIELLRDGKVETVYAEIRPQTWSGDAHHPALEGSTVGRNNAQDENFGELKGQGWVVRDIQPNSPASKLDLKVGDVILYPAPSRFDTIVDSDIEIYRDGQTLTISPQSD